jgi:hypothetical protein
LVSLTRGVINVQVREALLALPGGLSEARPIAELQRRMADLQAQVTAQPLEPTSRSDASTPECASLQIGHAGLWAYSPEVMRIGVFTDQADALEGRAVPRPTPSQFTALAAEAAAFITAGAGSPERIAALVSGLQVGDPPEKFLNVVRHACHYTPYEQCIMDIHEQRSARQVLLYPCRLGSRRPRPRRGAQMRPHGQNASAAATPATAT